jgi:hypothetical protein
VDRIGLCVCPGGKNVDTGDTTCYNNAIMLKAKKRKSKCILEIREKMNGANLHERCIEGVLELWGK